MSYSCFLEINNPGYSTDRMENVSLSFPQGCTILAVGLCCNVTGSVMTGVDTGCEFSLFQQGAV